MLRQLYWKLVILRSILSGAPTARRAAKRSPISIPYMEIKGIDFLMVIMANGIARGRVRTTATATVESRNMAAILQIIGWQRHAALVYCVLLWYWTSELWSTDTCQSKVSADQYHVTISRAQVYSSSSSSVFLKLTANQVLVFDWIAGSCLVNWWKQGRIVRKPANANPGLKVNRIISFSSIQMFLLFCVYGDYWNSKQKAKQYTENLSAKLQNSNKNSTFSLIGLWTTRPRSYAFRLAQIYILLFLSWWFWWNLSNKRTQAWRCFVKVILSTLCKRTLIFRQVLQEIIQFQPKIKNK